MYTHKEQGGRRKGSRKGKEGRRGKEVRSKQKWLTEDKHSMVLDVVVSIY